MAVRLTRNRIELINTALCHLASWYETGDDLESPPCDYSSWDKWESELDACHEWLRQMQRKRNKTKKATT